MFLFLSIVGNRLEQQLYIYLLQRYLLLKYGSDWELKLQKLMISLQELSVMTDLEMTVMLKQSKPFAHLFGPLMKEIYGYNSFDQIND